MLGMSRRTTKRIGGLIAVVVAAIAFWTWNGREHTAAPVNGPDIAHAESGGRDERILAPVADESRERAAAGSAEASPTVVTRATYALVRVLVVDKETRRPIGGMGVLARDATSGPPPRGAVPIARGKPGDRLVTGEDGRVEVEVAPGSTLRLLAYGDGERGHADARLESLEAGHTYEVELALPSGLDLPFWLKVVDLDTGAPIAGAAIRDPDERGVPTGDRLLLSTDAAGLVRLEAHTWMHRAFQVSADRHGVAYVLGEIGHETAERAYLLEMRRSGTLTVRVLDAARAPIVGANVVLGCAPYELARRDAATSNALIVTGDHTTYRGGTTDVAGTCTFDDLSSRVPFECRVLRKGHDEWQAPQPVQVAPGETRELLWIVGLEHVVRGRVVDGAGEPMPQCPVWMMPPDARGSRYFDGEDQRALGGADRRARGTTTDDAGEFAFDGVLAGTWLIGPGWTSNRDGTSSTAPAPYAKSVEITDETSEHLVELHVDRGLTIRGIVLDAHERPAQRARAHATSTVDRALCSAPVAEDGTFVLGPLLAGAYEVAASGGRGLASLETIDARAGASGLVLHVPPDGMIAGQVVDSAGVGVGAQVSCVGWRSRPLFATSTNSDVDGSFTLHQTGLEDVSIVATTLDGRVGVLGPLTFEEGAKPYDLAVRVERGGRIRFRHEGAEDHAQVSVHAGGAVVGFSSVPRSIAEEFVVPPGRVTVRVKYRRSGYEVVREVMVTADRTTDLVIEADAR